MTATLIPDLEAQLLDAAERRARPRRARRWYGLAAVGAVLIAGGATAAVVTRHHDSADPRVRAELGILRRPVTKADAVPGRGPRYGGIQPQEARRVRVDLRGWKAWVAPTRKDGSACLLVQEPDAGGPAANACFRVKDIVRATQGKAPHPETGTVTGGGNFVAGIVPDGVDHVTVTRYDKSRFRIAVHDNVYLGFSLHSTVTVSYGSVSTEARSPSYIAPPKPQTREQIRESERARSDPAKPRPVHGLASIQRRGGPSNVGTSRILYDVLWRARISGGAYAVRIRTPAGCKARRGVWLTPHRLRNSRRGRLLSISLQPPGDWYLKHYVTDAPTSRAWCHGTYKVDVAWVGNGRRYPPFGTGTFIVR